MSSPFARYVNLVAHSGGPDTDYEDDDVDVESTFPTDSLQNAGFSASGPRSEQTYYRRGSGDGPLMEPVTVSAGSAAAGNGGIRARKYRFGKDRRSGLFCGGRCIAVTAVLIVVLTIVGVVLVFDKREGMDSSVSVLKVDPNLSGANSTSAFHSTSMVDDIDDAGGMQELNEFIEHEQADSDKVEMADRPEELEKAMESKSEKAEDETVSNNAETVQSAETKEQVDRENEPKPEEVEVKEKPVGPFQAISNVVKSIQAAILDRVQGSRSVGHFEVAKMTTWPVKGELTYRNNRMTIRVPNVSIPVDIEIPSGKVAYARYSLDMMYGSSPVRSEMVRSDAIMDDQAIFESMSMSMTSDLSAVTALCQSSAGIINGFLNADIVMETGTILGDRVLDSTAIPLRLMCTSIPKPGSFEGADSDEISGMDALNEMIRSMESSRGDYIII